MALVSRRTKCGNLFTIIGKITKGKEGKPDATFVMLDEDLLSLAAGKLNPQSAFMTV